ncbi:hypothetical protein C7475_10213 [Chitinophaga sp. S165]|nr:hypothetical protein C7475_10213 [Chitinophaga sp. S165]
MKKLKLKALDLGAKEVLSRSQLKNILGGSDPYGSGSGTGTACSATAWCSSDRSITCDGYDYCYGRDGHSVTCSNGNGTPKTIKCF